MAVISGESGRVSCTFFCPKPAVFAPNVGLALTVGFTGMIVMCAIIWFPVDSVLGKAIVPRIWNNCLKKKEVRDEMKKIMWPKRHNDSHSSGLFPEREWTGVAFLSAKLILPEMPPDVEYRIGCYKHQKYQAYAIAHEDAFDFELQGVRLEESPPNQDPIICVDFPYDNVTVVIAQYGPCAYEKEFVQAIKKEFNRVQEEDLRYLN
jgi:hypothetical protein